MTRVSWLRQGYFYYIFGFLFLVGILTVIITIEVSIVTTYVQLCAEDYLWWCAPDSISASMTLAITCPDVQPTYTGFRSSN